MKYIDKFLKYLKTDRNTFVTYILTLITGYVVIDRLIELMFMIFTGVSFSYWGPIEYTLAIAACVLAFYCSFASKFARADIDKLRFFNSYLICLYIIGISALVQWLNSAAWIGLLSLPNYPELATEFTNLFRPAFTAISLYIPLVTFYKLFKWLTFKVNDVKDMKDSIFDYGGISLAGKDGSTGKFTCEVKLCVSTETGEDVIIPEAKRLESFLAVGVSGSRKNNNDI